MPIQVKASRPVSLTFTEADDSATVTLNGKEVGTTGLIPSGGTPATYELALNPGRNSLQVVATNEPGSATLVGQLTSGDEVLHRWNIRAANLKGEFVKDAVEIDFQPQSACEPSDVFSFSMQADVEGEREIDVDDRGTRLVIAVTSRQTSPVPDGWRLVAAKLVVGPPDLPNTVKLEGSEPATTGDDGSIIFDLPTEPILGAGVGATHTTKLTGVSVKTGAFATSGGDSAESRRYDVNCRVVSRWERKPADVATPSSFEFEVAKD